MVKVSNLESLILGLTESTWASSSVRHIGPFRKLNAIAAILDVGNGRRSRSSAHNEILEEIEVTTRTWGTIWHGYEVGISGIIIGRSLRHSIPRGKAVCLL